MFRICLLWIFFYSIDKLMAQEPKLILPIGHTQPINTAVFSPDGKMAATASDDRTIKIWDANSGQLLSNLNGHRNAVIDVEFSPDGKNIVSASSDSTATIWNLRTGQLLYTLKCSNALYGARYNKKGSEILTYGGDSICEVWNVNTGELLFELGYRNEKLVGVHRFGNNNYKIVTISKDGALKVRDQKTGQLIINFESYKDHKDGLSFNQFSEDGRKFLTSFFDGTIIIWDSESGKALFSLLKPNKQGQLPCLSPDGNIIAFHENDSIALIDVYNGRLLLAFKADNSDILQFSPDGKKIFTYDYSFSPDEIVVKIWDAKLGKMLTSLRGHKGSIRDVEPSTDSKKIISSSVDGTAKIWDANSGQLLVDLKSNSKKVIAKYGSKGEHILAFTDNYGIIWDVLNGNQMKLVGHSSEIRSAEFSNDEKRIVTTSFDSTARVWDAVTGRSLYNLKIFYSKADSSEFDSLKNKIEIKVGDFHGIRLRYEDSSVFRFEKVTKDGFGTAQFVPNEANKILIIYQNTARIWDLNTGKIILDFKGHHDWIKMAVFSSDGKKLLTASYDSTVKVWDLKTGNLETNIKSFDNWVNSAKFSSDGKKILTVTDAATVQVWNALNGNLLLRFKGTFAEFSPDNSKILSSPPAPLGKYYGFIGTVDRFNVSSDTLSIVDANNGRLIDFMKVQDEEIKNAKFSRDGNRIVISTPRSILECWNLNSKERSFQLADHVLPINSVEFNSSGNKIFTTCADNSLKIWDIENRKLLYSFIPVDSDNFLILDGDGHFDGTEGARKLLYYTCGTEVIDLDQINDLSWEPGLVSKIMGVNKEPITAKKLSEINICNYIPEVEEKGLVDGVYHFEITPRMGGIGEVQVYVNGKLVWKCALSSLTMKDSVYQLAVNQSEIESYFVSGRDNQVQAKATTREGTMTSRGATLTTDAARKPISSPNLYLIAAGISQYKGEKLQLKFASKDAGDFSAALSAAAQKLLGTDGRQHVHSFIFNTEPNSQLWPGKSAIKAAFDSVAAKATADDILVIFFAGHGILRIGEKNFYLVTAEATSFEQVQTLPAEVAIGIEELNQWMQKIKANKQLLILDACNSGQALDNFQDLIAKREVPADQQRALESLKEKTGTFILSASASGQAAYETSLYGQGLLTYSLLSGIKLGTGLRENKFIDVNDWFNDAARNTEIMAKDIGGRQQPQIIGRASFDVGLVDQEVQNGIKLSIKKKIFRRSKFIENEDILNDDLDLSGLVDKELNNISARGKEILLAYVADNTLIDAYSIRGKYEINGNKITVKVYLIKGQKQILYLFQIPGRVGKKEELATEIVKKVYNSLN